MEEQLLCKYADLYFHEATMIDDMDIYVHRSQNIERYIVFYR